MTFTEFMTQGDAWSVAIAVTVTTVAAYLAAEYLR